MGGSPSIGSPQSLQKTQKTLSAIAVPNHLRCDDDLTRVRRTGIICRKAERVRLDDFKAFAITREA
jgi:hypothetical protein